MLLLFLSSYHLLCIFLSHISISLYLALCLQTRKELWRSKGAYICLSLRSFDLGWSLSRVRFPTGEKKERCNALPGSFFALTGLLFIWICGNVHYLALTLFLSKIPMFSQVSVCDAVVNSCVPSG
jgi:hypothetical protein